MSTVTLFYRNQAHSDEVKVMLEELQAEIPFSLVVIDVMKDDVLRDIYQDIVPIVRAGPFQLKYPFTKQELVVMIHSANDRETHLEAVGDSKFKKRKERGSKISNTDRVTGWFSKNYMGLVIAILLIYVGLPFLAPVLMHSGAIKSANVIYKMYSVLCHQMAFRSWFLYGYQAAYPSELVHVDNLDSYEMITGQTGIRNQNEFNIDQYILQARNFAGNEIVGYKVALCERDIAMYGSMLMFGIIFTVNGRKIKPLSWKIWILIGLLPIALDGISQLPGFLQWMNGNIPFRESTPLIRTITGTLFGITTGWYLFPVIEETMLETRRLLTWKYARVDQVGTVKD